MIVKFLPRAKNIVMSLSYSVLQKQKTKNQKGENETKSQQ